MSAIAYHSSIITAGNGGTQPTQAALTIFYNQGTQKYELVQTLQPDEQMWIDIGKLIREHVADKNGNTLPPTATSGSFEIRDLTHTGLGTLFEGKITYDKTYGHAAYGCGVCCGYNAAILWYDPINLGFQGSPVADGVWGYNVCSQGYDDVTSSFYGDWSSQATSIVTVDYYGTHTPQNEGSTTTNTCGDIESTAHYPLCPALRRCPQGGANVKPSVAITGASSFAFVGSDPTIPKVLQQAVGKPDGGNYSWTASPTGRISFDNPSSDVVNMSGINPSTSVGDTTLTVNYSVGTQSATATSTATSRIFVYLALNTQISVPPPSGKYGYDYRLTYDTYTCPGGQILQPGFSGISVPESISVSSTNMPGATTHTGTGATDPNSEFTDRLALISNQPIPSNASEVDTQEIFVGGIFVRNNTLNYSATTITVTNNGTFSCTH
ncbi:MAG: hypothetical protein AUH13_06475 [Acidobacteria bacterium 13_2_20CM_58_27]|nr:MAG: hypothetical protein AUH13_06475 [Acidobacteria bacterium 13_2_20CM_58_27]